MISKPKTDLEQAGTQSTSDNSRRSAIQKIALGTAMASGVAALPGKWTKPVVNAVLIPAHARTSDEYASVPGEQLPATLAPACNIVTSHSLPGFIVVFGTKEGGPGTPRSFDITNNSEIPIALSSDITGAMTPIALTVEVPARLDPQQTGTITLQIIVDADLLPEDDECPVLSSDNFWNIEIMINSLHPACRTSESLKINARPSVSCTID